MNDYTAGWAPFQEEATISQLQDAMERGEITSLELVHMYLHRIAKFNKQGPSINAVLEINPDAEHIADALDRERQTSGPRGPMHGIPVLLKDNIDTGDHMHTSAGSITLANSYAARDSKVAENLRKAGAVILGKVNLTEWANFMTDNMPNGFSSRGGQVLNPYGPGTFDVGGSSAGSGAATAANFAVVAVGTETSGSILSPSSQNSLVGIKPTVGLISRRGIIPISHAQDTAGPMTRTVRDAAILLGALAGVDEEDPATLSSVGRAPKDYTQYLRDGDLKGIRLGIPRAFYEGLDEARTSLIEAAFDVLRSLGADVIDPVDLTVPKEVWNYDVLIYEFKSDLNAYLKGVSEQVPVHSLEEVIAYNQEHADVALKHGQTILLQSQDTSGTLTEEAYLQARLNDVYASRKHGIDKVLQEYQLDALVFVNNYGAALPAKAGYPSITVPAGYTPEGEPVGVTFSSRAFSEPDLLRIAYAYEQATHHRVAPKLD